MWYQAIPFTLSGRDQKVKFKPTRVGVKAKCFENVFPVKNGTQGHQRERDIMSDKELNDWASQEPTDCEIQPAEDDEGDYEVDFITDHKRLRDRSYMFKIRWKGYDEDHDTWHAESDLTECADSIQEYMEEKGLRKKTYTETEG